jgi:hypothetical protein
MPRPRPPELGATEKVVTISVRFPESVMDGLRDVAKEEERTLNTVIVRAARRYIEEDLPERTKKR